MYVFGGHYSFCKLICEGQLVILVLKEKKKRSEGIAVPVGVPSGIGRGLTPHWSSLCLGCHADDGRAMAEAAFILRD